MDYPITIYAGDYEVGEVDKLPSPSGPYQYQAYYHNPLDRQGGAETPNRDEMSYLGGAESEAEARLMVVQRALDSFVEAAQNDSEGQNFLMEYCHHGETD